MTDLSEINYAGGKGFDVFEHRGVEYTTWGLFEGDSTDEFAQILISEVVQGDGAKEPSLTNADFVIASESSRNGMSIPQYISLTVIPRFNAWLGEKPPVGGGEFPADGTEVERYTWVMTKAVSYDVSQGLLAYTWPN